MERNEKMSYDNDWKERWDEKQGCFVPKRASFMEPDQIDVMNEDELRGELRKLIARPSSCTVESIVRNMWNHFADGYNQWDSLGQDEKDTLFKIAVANGKDDRT